MPKMIPAPKVLEAIASTAVILSPTKAYSLQPEWLRKAIEDEVVGLENNHLHIKQSGLVSILGPSDYLALGEDGKIYRIDASLVAGLEKTNE